MIFSISYFSYFLFDVVFRFVQMNIESYFSKLTYIYIELSSNTQNEWIYRNMIADMGLSLRHYFLNRRHQNSSKVKRI